MISCGANSNHLIQMSCKPAEFEQCVAFKFFRKRDVVEVVEAVNRVSQSFVIFLLDQQSIVSVVDRLDVEL